MSHQHPNIITLQEDAELEVLPLNARMSVVIEGESAFFGNEAFSKSKEVSRFVAEAKELDYSAENISLQDVSIQSNSGKLLSSSSAVFSLKLDNIPLALVPELLGIAASQKNISVKNVAYDFGALKTEKAELLKAACTTIKQQAEEICESLGLPLIGIYSMTQHWQQPSTGEPAHHASAGLMKTRSVSRSLEGLNIVVNRKGTLSLHLAAEFRVGDFSQQ